MSRSVPPPGPQERTVIRRAAKRAKLPLVSGSGSVVVLVLCFLISAVAVFLVGWTAHWPLWIDFEIMLLLWWLAWIVALGRLLYLGVRLSDDRREGVQPRNWFSGDWGSGWGDATMFDFSEGCVFAVGLLLAAVAFAVLAWVFIEVIIPVLAILLYGLIRGMLARVVNDEHGCAHQFAKSLLWGTVWASVYTGPLALLVWVVHLIVANKPAV